MDDISLPPQNPDEWKEFRQYCLDYPIVNSSSIGLFCEQDARDVLIQIVIKDILESSPVRVSKRLYNEFTSWKQNLNAKMKSSID